MRNSFRRHRRAAASFAFAVGAGLLPASVQAQIPTSLTFFGDSFLDTGNGDIIAARLGAADPTPSPPYAPGRITDGMNWADYLAMRLGRPTDAAPSLLGGRNYAIGTATTGLTGVSDLPLGMLSQYGQQARTAADPTGVYVLFGGANDLLAAAALPTAVLREAAVQSAVDNLSTIARGLYLQGARRFLIPNLPNIGLAPLALGTPGSPILSAEAALFNVRLGQQLSVLGGLLTGATFTGLSLDVLFNNILIDASEGGPRYGLTNTTAPCLLTAAPCGTAVFADQLHPSTIAHRLIADAAYNRIVTGRDVTTVPEPSTVVLLAGGLIAVGVLRRRRALSAATRAG